MARLRPASNGPSESSLGHLAPPRWEFDGEVTRVFEDMLRRSIPDYESMRRVVFELGCRFVAPGSTILDLGSSRGAALAPFVEAFGDAVNYVGVELSEPMLAACRDRFAAQIAAGSLRMLALDLRRQYPDVESALTLAVLTFQFVPPEHRPRLAGEVFEHTAPGGALLLVEKVISSSPRVDALLRDAYRDRKRDSGYGLEEIDRKRLSLEGVLVPLAPAWNEELLVRAGFAEVECVWRSLNFAAWLAIRA